MKKERGITLVALVITVIVMLILAGVALSAISGDAGLFGRVQKTAELYNNQSKTEAGTVEELIDSIIEYGDPNVSVNVGGETVKLTRKNVNDYMGKVVTNFKIGTEDTEETTEPIEIDGQSYEVSTTYRLYYVDFDGKYGEKGTIYLKADHSGKNYHVPTTDTTLLVDATDAEEVYKYVKIRDLNPGLYYEEEGEEGIPLPNRSSSSSITSPDVKNENMKAVTWLTNTKNWEGLTNKKNVNSEIRDSINYIVGAPSLEMMIDSYNTYYSGKDKDKGGFDINATLDTQTQLNGTNNRVKLFYKYPYNNNKYGYAVGPSIHTSAEDEYYYATRDYSVKIDTESNIGSMYYPGSDKCYWLASPSANGLNNIMDVYGSSGGYVGNFSYYNDGGALCPLVSLKSSVQLELDEN